MKTSKRFTGQAVRHLWVMWIIVGLLITGCAAPAQEAAIATEPPEAAPTEALAEAAAPTEDPPPAAQPPAAFTIDQDSRIERLAYSPDGTTALVSGLPVRLVDVSTGEILREFPPTTYLGAFGAGGSQIITISMPGLGDDPLELYEPEVEREVTIWDAASGEALQRISVTMGFTHELALSSDGSLAASLSENEEYITIWDVASGEQRVRFGGADENLGLIYRITFSPDSRYLYAEDFNPQDSMLLDTATGEQVARWDMQAFYDPVTRTIKLPVNYFDVYNPEAAGQEIELSLAESIEHAERLRIEKTVLSPDGSTIVTLTRRYVFAWDRETGAELWRVEVPWLDLVVFSADSSRVMAYSWDCEGFCSESPNEVFVWDAANGDELLYVELASRLFYAAISPDGSSAAFAENRAALFTPVDAAYSTERDD